MISLKVQESGGRVQLLPVRRSVDQFLVYSSLDGEVCLDKTSAYMNVCLNIYEYADICKQHLWYWECCGLHSLSY